MNPIWYTSSPRPDSDRYVPYAKALQLGYLVEGNYLYDTYGQLWQITTIHRHAEGTIIYIAVRDDVLGHALLLVSQISYVEIPRNE